MPAELLISPWGGVFWIIAVTTALVAHEFMHAVAAYALGDQTPKLERRITLNPFPHIEPLGFFLLLLFGVGWARPVRFEVSNLRFKKFGPTIVALAGPLANGFLLLFTITMAHLFPPDSVFTPNLHAFFSSFIIINALLAVVNFIPLPPFDGSKFLLDVLGAMRLEGVQRFLTKNGQYILIALLAFDNFVGPNILEQAILWLTEWAQRLMI